MKNSFALVSKLITLALFMVFVSSCIKSNDFIKGDAKVRFYNTVETSLPQDFYLNADRFGTAVRYGANTPYVVVPGDSAIVYKIVAKNTSSTAGPSAAFDYTFNIGKNYSVFYTKSSVSDSLLYIRQDDVTPDTAVAKVFIINLGYSLKKPVQVRDSTNTAAKKVLAYKDNSGYLKLNPATTRLYFTITDSTTKDSLPGRNFFKGKIYTILLDGSQTGDLRTRLITVN